MWDMGFEIWDVRSDSLVELNHYLTSHITHLTSNNSKGLFYE